MTRLQYQHPDLDMIGVGLFITLIGIPIAWAIWVAALDGLMNTSDPEPDLRRFERLVLKESGYEVTFDTDADTGEPVVATRGYAFVADQGFHVATQQIDERNVFAGSTLLAISRNVIEGLGGTISMQSQPGQGTTVTVVLPSTYSL